ncbi:MAG: hypothetical protein ABIH99_01330 [Candidatus Micrarchaeota archaeon]
MQKMLIVVAVMLFVGLCAGASVKVEAPVQEVVEDKGSVYIGLAGSGQTVSVEVYEKTAVGGTHGTGGRWDQLVITSVPEGWNSSSSLLYEEPLKAKIRISPNASDGAYMLTAVVVDENNGEKLGNVTIYLIVNVSVEVLDIEVSPKEVRTGAGQPGGYYITIKNRGVASDVFLVGSTGVPLWKFKKTVFVPYESERIVRYEVVSAEEKTVEVEFQVVSTSSPLIHAEKKATLVVSTSLSSDYRAVGSGTLIFPGIELPVYSILGFLSNWI